MTDLSQEHSDEAEGSETFDPLMRERQLHTIVPGESVAGTALIAVIAIMSFLASLTLGALLLVNKSAQAWQLDVTREVTVQIKPATGADVQTLLKTAQKISEEFEGIQSARIISVDTSNKLLEPWLGSGLDLSELPIPRLVALTLDETNPADLAKLNAELNRHIAGVSIDNHSAWVDRLGSMTTATVAVGFIVFLLMLIATVLTVVFATRGAMSGNQHVIEVLHFVGAERSYIASQFQRHFLLLGLKGSAIGGGAAIVVFVILSLVFGEDIADPVSDQMAALFGSFNIGLAGYGGALFLILAIALLTAATSRLTVFRHVGSIESRADMTDRA